MKLHPPTITKTAYYDDGSIFYICSFLADDKNKGGGKIRHGTDIYFHGNGYINHVVKYTNGHIDGWERVYSKKTGKLIAARFRQMNRTLGYHFVYNRLEDMLSLENFYLI